MAAEPTMPNFEWVRCINAKADEAHFPCNVCEWKLKTPPPA